MATHFKGNDLRGELVVSRLFMNVMLSLAGERPET